MSSSVETARIRKHLGIGALELPEVTAEDNGSVLGVVDGNWAKMTAPSGGPEITWLIENESITASYDAIKEYYCTTIESPLSKEEWAELAASTTSLFVVIDGIWTVSPLYYEYEDETLLFVCPENNKISWMRDEYNAWHNASLYCYTAQEPDVIGIAIGDQDHTQFTISIGYLTLPPENLMV